jgi:beta-mannosidase
MAKYNRISLDSGWHFKQIDAVGVPESIDDFLPVAQFPTNIHLDLLAHGKIPDPFIGLNEYEVQWVGEQKWCYRTEFECAKVSNEQKEKLVLQFDGVDTFATISLNGEKIYQTDNMHRTYRVDITDTVETGTNILEILFDSAIIRGMKLVDESGFVPGAATKSTDSSRLLVRKAQYHYSWNWGKITKSKLWMTY